MNTMNESLRKILYYENILQFKENTQSELMLREVNNWQLCRTCLAETKDGDCDLEKMCVMDALEGRFLNVQEMLTKVTTIQLSRDRELPEMMCKDCLERLTTLYYFSIQVNRASAILKKLSQKLKGKTKDTQLKAGLEDREVNEKPGKEGQDIDICAVEDIGKIAVCSNDEIEIKILPPSAETSKLIENTLEELDFEIVDAKEESEADVYSRGDTEDPDLDEGNGKEELDAGVCCQDDVDTDQVLNPTKQEICEYPEPAESHIYIEEHVEAEEHLDEKNDNSPSISYTVEEEEGSQQTDIDNEEIDVHFRDELAEHLTEKKEITDDDIVYLDETTSSSYSEPIKKLKTPRITKATRKTLFKHKQPRVTKPLLESTKCAVCQEVFKRQRDLVAHVKENHPSSKAFQCRECNQLFSHTQSLSRHMNTHKPVLKKNICSYCSKAFLRLDDLTRHIRTHTGERPYGCPMCEKAFKQQGEMKQHLATHMQRKNYECPQCDKVLTSRNSLYAHKKTHNVPMDHHLLKCLQCPKSFVNEKHFLIHEKQHNMEKDDGIECQVLEI